jgi:hypothetical protein
MMSLLYATLVWCCDTLSCGNALVFGSRCAIRPFKWLTIVEPSFNIRINVYLHACSSIWCTNRTNLRNFNWIYSLSRLLSLSRERGRSRSMAVDISQITHLSILKVTHLAYRLIYMHDSWLLEINTWFYCMHEKFHKDPQFTSIYTLDKTYFIHLSCCTLSIPNVILATIRIANVCCILSNYLSNRWKLSFHDFHSKC